MHKLSLKSLPFPQEFLIPVCLIVIIIGAVIFYVMPTWGKYQEANNHIANEQKEIQALTTKKEALAALDDNELRRQLSEVRAAVPEGKDVASVIAGMSRLTQENGLSIISLTLQPGKLATNSASQEVTLKMILKGNLRNMSSFMDHLAQVRRLFNMQKYTGTAGPSSDGSDFTSNVEITFSTLPLPTNLGKSFADPLPDLDATKRKLIDTLASYPIYTDLNSTSSLPVFSASPSASPVQATASAQPTSKPAASATASASVTGQ